MRRILLFIFIFLCNHHKVEAQEHFQISNTKDSIKAFILLKHARELRNIDLDSSLFLSRKALNISQRIKNIKGIAHSLLDIGIYLFDQEEFLKSKAIFNAAFPYCESVSNSDKSILPRLYNNLANIYLIQGHSDSAIFYYFKTLARVNQTDSLNKSLKMTIYANVGAALASGKYSQQSLHYLRKSNLLATQLNDSNLVAQNYVNMGLAYIKLDNNDSALHFFQLALPINHLKHYKKSLQNNYFYIGNVYGNKGKLAEAKLYFDSATWADPKRAQENASLQRSLGDIYFVSKDYKKAIQFYKQSLEIAFEEGSYKKNIPATYNLAQSYHILNQDDLAFKYQKIYSDLKDSMINEQSVQAVNQLEVKYRTAENKQELTAKQLLIIQQDKAILQRNTWIIGILLVTLIFTVFFINRNRINKQKQADQIKKIRILEQHQEMQHQAQEINQLKAIMQGEEKERIRIARDLHDGIVSQLLGVKLHFNGTLQNKEGKILKIEDFQTTLNYLDNATSELRKTAHNLMPESVLQEGLVNALHSYCKKMTTASTTKIEFQLIGNLSGIDPEIELSLYRIVQELIQNVLKHAKASFILVQLNAQDTFLSITVEDNGVGCSKNTIAKTNGIGLKSIFTRVKALNGQIEISGKNGIGTSIYIEIDIANI